MILADPPPHQLEITICMWAEKEECREFAAFRRAHRYWLVSGLRTCASQVQNPGNAIRPKGRIAAAVIHSVRAITAQVMNRLRPMTLRHTPFELVYTGL